MNIPAVGQMSQQLDKGPAATPGVRRQTLTHGTCSAVPSCGRATPQGWLGGPARHGGGFGSGPRQPCVARGWHTGHGNSSTSGRLCSQEGWIAAGTAKQSAGAWRKTMLAFAKQPPWNCRPCLALVYESGSQSFDSNEIWANH